MQLMYPTLVCLILLLGSSIPVGADPKDGCPSPDDRDDISLPTWRLQVKPYGFGGGDLSLGLYHRLGTRWDVGLQIDSRFANFDTDGDEWGTYYDGTPETGQITTETRRRSLSVRLDLRRWYSIADRASWFLGPQASYGYSSSRVVDDRRSDGEEYSSSSHTVTDRDRLTTGISFALGADLQIVSRLSLAMVLRPVHLYYTWETDESEWTRVSSSQEGTRVRFSEVDVTGGSIETDIAAEAYVTLHL